MNREQLEVQEQFEPAGPGSGLRGITRRSLEGTWHPGGCRRTQPFPAPGRETRWLTFVGCVLSLIFASLGAQAQTVIATIKAGARPRAVVVNPITDTTYVANENSDNITVIYGPANQSRTLGVSGHPTALAVNQRLDELYVVSGLGDSLTVIGVEDRITYQTGDYPAAVAVNPSRTKSTWLTSIPTTFL
jgi:hypothetical protein